MANPADGATAQSSKAFAVGDPALDDVVQNTLLDDVIKFSLPSLVALAGETLFSSEHDRRCWKLYLEDLMKNLQLDEPTKKSVLIFMKRSIESSAGSKDGNAHIEPLVTAIRSKIWTPLVDVILDNLADEQKKDDVRSEKTVESQGSGEKLVASQGNTDHSEKTAESQGSGEKLVANEGNTDQSEKTAVADEKIPRIEVSSSGGMKHVRSADSLASADSAKPSPTPLNSTLNEEVAAAIISCLIVTALIRGRYDSRIRIIIRYIVHKLRIKWDLVEEVEDSLVEHFSEAKVVQTEEEKKEIKRAHRLEKIKRIAAVGIATVIGGVAIGVTGGLLAAPAVAAAVGGIAAAGGVGAFLGTTAGAAVIGSLFGAFGAGLSGYKMNRRVGVVEEFEFVPLTEGQQLHLAVALPGWLSSEQPDCRTAYYTLSIAREQYCLKFESRYLIELGNALDYFLNIATSSSTANVASEIAKQSAVGSFWLAVAWPQLLLSAANVIDNPWSICLRRSAKAGEQLAEVLLSRQQGHRPVTLIGFSLGARAVFHCLKEMSREKHSAYSGGIVQNVILLGAPVSAASKEWSSFSRVIAGEIINGYSRTDWLLKFLYRTTSVKNKIAGLGPVDWQDRRMFNIDLSHIISGHGDYLHKMDLVLTELGIGGRRKATLMSLADSRRQMSASSSFAGSSLRTTEAPKRSVSTSLAIEQLHLAEKLRSESSADSAKLSGSLSLSFTDSESSAVEAEMLNSGDVSSVVKEESLAEAKEATSSK